MLDFESCQSLEKLVLDNEICGMALRLTRGIQPKEDFPALPRFEELLRETHLLISEHTQKYLREELYFPGPVIDRANRPRWQDEGSSTLLERAQKQVETLVKSYVPSRLSDTTKKELTKIMSSEARRCGMTELPRTDV
jgi:trimethylamine--corrinoid protein Co-methyltransferase